MKSFRLEFKYTRDLYFINVSTMLQSLFIFPKMSEKYINSVCLSVRTLPFQIVILIPRNVQEKIYSSMQCS